MLQKVRRESQGHVMSYPSDSSHRREVMSQGHRSSRLPVDERPSPRRHHHHMKYMKSTLPMYTTHMSPSSEDPDGLPMTLHQYPSTHNKGCKKKLERGIQDFEIQE